MQTETAPLPPTAKEAKRVGSQFYFTGIPCVRGHVSKRYAKNGTCAVCSSEKKREWEAANPEKKAVSRASYRRRHSDQIKEGRREWRRTHKKEEAEKARKRYLKNREAIIAKSTAWYLANREYVADRYKAWKAENSDYYPKWREENAEKIKAYGRQRYLDGEGAERAKEYARIRNKGTFKAEDLRSKVKEVGELCRRVTSITGVMHHVDHVVPVVSDNVCGLNVPWNLRVVTAACNIGKGDQMPAIVEVLVSSE